MRKLTNLDTIIRTEIIDRLEEIIGSEYSEAMYELFNTNLYIIGTEDAKEFCGKYPDFTMWAIEKYRFDFGDEYQYLADWEKLATLVVLFTAEEIWNNLEIVNGLWDKQVKKSHLAGIKREILATRYQWTA